MASPDRTVAFIGCGNMGGAILHGVLDAAFSSDSPKSRPVSRFIACTNTAASASCLQASLSTEHQSHVKVVSGEIVQTMNEADVVILGFKPFMADDVLSLKGVRKALSNKLVISLLAGQTLQNLGRIIRESMSTTEPIEDPVIVKAMPNMGAQFRQSMTVLETPLFPLSAENAEVLEWVFGQVGAVKYLPQSQMDLATVVGGAALAALTVPIEGMLDGCVVEGLKRADAMELLLQGIRGLSAALEAGIHPAALRESISSPRGCTIQALLTLEKAGSRADYAEAIINGTQHLKKANK